jgi:glycosyltransferase involved in cell wall biosynthesis
MIEAVSSGTPVVSFDVCSARGLLDDGCGVVVDAQDFGALADVLSELIDDADRRQVMGETAARVGETRFDSLSTGKRYDELYAALLGASSPT